MNTVVFTTLTATDGGIAFGRASGRKLWIARHAVKRIGRRLAAPVGRSDNGVTDGVAYVVATSYSLCYCVRLW